MKKNPLTFGSKCWFWTKCAVWLFVWGVPVGAIGCVFCILIVTAPIGFVLITIAALPLARMVRKYGEEVTKCQPVKTQVRRTRKQWQQGRLF